MQNKDKVKKGNKGAIPINLFVYLIIGLIVLGLGMNLLHKFIYEGNKKVEEMEGKAEEKIRNMLLTTGGPVVIYPNHISLSRGEKKDVYIGIRNMETNKINVRINVDCTPGISHIFPGSSSNIEIGEGEIKTIGMLIEILGSGTHSGSNNCIIKVKKSGKIYGEAQILTIEVT